MKRITTLLIFILFLTLISYGQADWKLLDESGYSIQYPGDWDLDTSGQMGSSFILFSKQSTPQDQFRENINFLIQDLTGYGLNLDKYAEISVNQIKTMITNGQLLENKKLKANGLEFQKVVYTGDQGIFKLKFEQYYWVKNDKAHVLTFTTEVAQFDTYKETGEKILNSFLLK